MTFAEFHAQLSAEEQVALEERAAIIEYDGKTPPAQAEELAMADWLRQQSSATQEQQ